MACGWQNSCRPRSCNYLQNAGATTYKNFLQFYAKKACKKHAAATYGVHSLPTTYFIDEEGNAIAQATGAIDEETLQQGIDMIISDR